MSEFYMAGQSRYWGTSFEFETLTRNLLHIAMNKCVLLSNGVILAQDVPGIVPSGSYQTGSYNSLLRGFYRYNYDRTLMITCGDDGEEAAVPDLSHLLDYYRSVGLVVKPEPQLTTSTVSLCSHTFSLTGGVVPTRGSVEKMLMKAWCSNDPQVLCSISMELEEAVDHLELIPYVLSRGDEA
jgi:hypothetical protein